jgi:hypothetical protein
MNMDATGQHTELPWTNEGRTIYSGDRAIADTKLIGIPDHERHANAALICTAVNSHDWLVLLMQQAVARVELANAEGDPILSAWLLEAKSALRFVEKHNQTKEPVMR